MEAGNISYTDLLIVGAGPAGLMAAAWASRFNVSARIIDKKSARVSRGHADGLQCRTMEILDSFGLADRIRKEGFHDIEICSWDPCGDYGIRRAQKVLSQKVGVSRFPQTIIHQGYIEQTILDFLEHDGGLYVERCAEPRDISVDYSLAAQQDSYPITVKMEFYENREISANVNRHSPSVSGQRLRNNVNRSVSGSVDGHEEKKQNQANGNSSKAVENRSEVKLMKIENGISNGIFKRTRGQPTKAFRTATHGAATSVVEKPSEHFTNGVSEPKSNVEIIKAKYLLGCDGARSWTRQQLGIPLDGNQTQNVWGVIDIIPLTDFPDIRQTCVIRSAKHGSIMIAPREGRLARLYVQLNEISAKDGKSAVPEITPALILGVAQNILKPYSLDFKCLDWWSVYRIQQRVASQFSVANRIFLTGDAIHTHSPKLGQGMNVSMQDTYNLGWKICSVINGTAREEILKTYETERRQVALDLIAADLKISNYYSQTSLDKHVPKGDYKSLRDSLYEFLSGAAVNYAPSILTLKQSLPSTFGDVLTNEKRLSETSSLATNLNIGMRCPSYKLINQADARCVHLADMLPSDGRWRILTFAGDITNTDQFRRVQLLGEFLASPGSVLGRFTPSNRPIDARIEVLTIHSGPRAEVNLLSLHNVFHPFDETMGWDYWKVLVDEPSAHEGFDDVYGKFGIDRQRGCLVICRPDQHVGCVLDLEDFMAVSAYFERILIPVAVA